MQSVRTSRERLAATECSLSLSMTYMKAFPPTHPIQSSQHVIQMHACRQYRRTSRERLAATECSSLSMTYMKACSSRFTWNWGWFVLGCWGC